MLYIKINNTKIEQNNFTFFIKTDGSKVDASNFIALYYKLNNLSNLQSIV